MDLPAPISKTLNLTATVLETTAGVLRTVAGTPSSPKAAARAAASTAASAAPSTPSPPAEPSGPAADVPAPTPHAGTKPAPGTRSQAAISKPKAARKVRHRGAPS